MNTNNTLEHCMCVACRDGVIHASDCAVHNEPAMPIGPCTCGANGEPDMDYMAIHKLRDLGFEWNGTEWEDGQSVVIQLYFALFNAEALLLQISEHIYKGRAFHGTGRTIKIAADMAKADLDTCRERILGASHVHDQ